MAYKIAVLAGDGIGEEVMQEALKVLAAVSRKFNQQFQFSPALVGGSAFDKFGEHFPQQTQDICSDSDAILFGSVGGPVNEQHLEKWKNCEAKSLLAIRKAFNFNANFRPVVILKGLEELCPIKPERFPGGIDMLFIRELVGDIYFGEHKTEILAGGRKATDVAEYTEAQIRDVAVVAFEAAKKRSFRVTSVDKANVLDTSKLWREVVTEVAIEYPEVILNHLLVDNCAMQLILNPSQFDVILTSNMFGDILSDAAAVLPGSLGLLSSASLNSAGFGMFEPPGGSAPDIAGKGIANPIGQILAAALMLRHAFGLTNEVSAIQNAVNVVIQKGYRTKDILTPNAKLVSTGEMGDLIANAI
jgi:3-isopropylmalate dehydrogenase